MVKRRPLNVFSLFKSYFGTSSESLKGHFISPPEQDRLGSYIEERSRLAHLRVAKVQFGVWYKPRHSPPIKVMTSPLLNTSFCVEFRDKDGLAYRWGGDAPWHHALLGALDGYVYV